MNKNLNYQVKKRMILAFVGFLLVLLLLGFRLFWIQVVKSDEFRNKALEQRVRELQVEPKRGEIIDRNGKKLAVSVSRQTVVALPREVEEPKNTARTLANILEMDYQKVYDRVTRSASAVYIKRKIDEEKEKQIKNQDLPGITFTEESKRYYPHDNLASQIIGFAGIDSQGLGGIELSYDRYLRGTPGKITSERDASGKTIPGGVEQFIEPQDGYNLQLTIDEVIQYITERELEHGVEEMDISGGTAIVMDPRDGSILALANRPDFDLNNFADYGQKEWRNRAISDTFEPGSTFKIVTLASALEQGVIAENDVFTCSGEIKVSGETIECWEEEGHGRQSLGEVVQNSCNPGFVQIGMRLGHGSFHNYIKAFNFGEKTNIKLPGEATGSVTDFSGIGPVELATMSFGHGITVSPIQLISAVSAVANGGTLYRPRLVEKIIAPQKDLKKDVETKKIKQIISEKTADQARQMLGRVVAAGTGENAQIEGYEIGGKTGTAKHYGEEVYDTSFVGFLPLDNPQLVILVVLYDVTEYPYYGSQTAAPIFQKITHDILRYLEISPEKKNEKKEEKEEVTLPDLQEIRVHEAENKLRKQGLNVNIVGNGDYVYKQVPVPDSVVEEETTVILFTEDDYDNLRNYYISVPDLEGYHVEEARDLLTKLGLRLDYSGSGEIVEQEVEPGERVPVEEKIKVKTKP
ncbi:MAG: penicillin-binding transpeptidase domain-containing protein [Bacillota bacterium]